MEEILKTNIIREKGYLYFCKSLDNKLVICRSKMGRKSKHEEIKTEEKEKQIKFFICYKCGYKTPAVKGKQAKEYRCPNDGRELN